MSEIVKYKAEHLLKLLDSPALAKTKTWVPEKSVFALEKLPYVFTFLKNKDPVAVVGVNEMWPGRGIAFAFFTEGYNAEFVAVHRAVKKFLKSIPVKRIEMTVEKNFSQGHRWAKMLGFKLEADLMKNFGPLGEDHSLYSLVKGES